MQRSEGTASNDEVVRGRGGVRSFDPKAPNKGPRRAVCSSTGGRISEEQQRPSARTLQTRHVNKNCSKAPIDHLPLLGVR